MRTWGADDVVAVAPDPSSMAAARRLARPGPWTDTGATDGLVWGRCQGSGREPYQVSVDLSGPAYRCSCPSRKIPCKHVLALLLLWVEGRGDLAAEAPDFARERADERTARAGRRPDAARPGSTPTGEDPQAAARRLENRLAGMSAGIEDLGLWLTDVVRDGLAAARRRPLSWWDATAARLVDAQLPGLADDVRRMGSEVNRGEEWVEPLLADLARLWAATCAWQRRDDLGDHARGDLRAAVGWAVTADAVRAGDRLADTWLVLGVHRSDTGRLAEQRTWLLGEAGGEVVQVLDFAAGGSVLPVARLAGARLRGAVSRYPGAGVRRALFTKEPEVIGAGTGLPAGGDLADAATARAEVLTRNPWTRRVPVLLRGVRLVVDGAGGAPEADVRVVDGAGRTAPVRPVPDPWPLVALTGGAPVDLFAELEGGALRVLSAGGVPGTVGVVTS